MHVPGLCGMSKSWCGTVLAGLPKACHASPPSRRGASGVPQPCTLDRGRGDHGAADGRHPGGRAAGATQPPGAAKHGSDPDPHACGPASCVQPCTTPCVRGTQKSRGGGEKGGKARLMHPHACLRRWLQVTPQGETVCRVCVAFPQIRTDRRKVRAGGRAGVVVWAAEGPSALNHRPVRGSTARAQALGALGRLVRGC